MILPKVGQKYRHFKGGLYEVIANARSSEDEDIALVVYGARLPDGGFSRVWVRPLVMWNESVKLDDSTFVKRFKEEP